MVLKPSEHYCSKGAFDWPSDSGIGIIPDSEADGWRHYSGIFGTDSIDLMDNDVIWLQLPECFAYLLLWDN